jgi:hypothetical protein
MSADRSRFEDVSRRAFLQRSAALGLAATGLLSLAACGSDDAAMLGAPAAADPEGSATPVTSALPDTTAAPAAPVTTAAATLPDRAELQIAFTFAATGGGRVENPYIAVWIEDEAGEMVQTVSLWLMQGKGEKWWKDLTRWYDAQQERAAAGGPATIDTITGATRTAGDYTVVWDGTGYDGAKVAQGNYFVCIEAAREKGPYELVREALTLGSESFDMTFAPQGELTAAAVTYAV